MKTLLIKLQALGLMGPCDHPEQSLNGPWVLALILALKSIARELFHVLRQLAPQVVEAAVVAAAVAAAAVAAVFAAASVLSQIAQRQDASASA